MPFRASNPTIAVNIYTSDICALCQLIPNPEVGGSLATSYLAHDPFAFSGMLITCVCIQHTHSAYFWIPGRRKATFVTGAQSDMGCGLWTA